jgi:hypothetical protein
MHVHATAPIRHFHKTPKLRIQAHGSTLHPLFFSFVESIEDGRGKRQHGARNLPTCGSCCSGSAGCWLQKGGARARPLAFEITSREPNCDRGPRSVSQWPGALILLDEILTCSEIFNGICLGFTVIIIWTIQCPVPTSKLQCFFLLSLLLCWDPIELSVEFLLSRLGSDCLFHHARSSTVFVRCFCLDIFQSSMQFGEAISL